MKTSHSKRVVLSATIAALLVGSAAVASAQKERPSGPPAVTKGSTKANDKAAKGQATAEAARVEAGERKAEKSAGQLARREPKSLLKGVTLTAADKKSTKAIKKHYAAQFKALAKSEKLDDKAGTDNVDYLARVEALRIQERAELRAALTPQQQVQFDANVVSIGVKKTYGQK
jgi:hypothetical protein